ncbi:hypothetical protein ACI8AA_01260 [Geodermatophilus sp. SYSU D01180]
MFYRRAIATLALAATVTLAACSEQDAQSADPSGTSAAPTSATEDVASDDSSAALTEFCELADQLRSSQDFHATTAIIESMVEAAPADFREQMAAYLSAWQTGDNMTLAAAGEPVDAYLTANCGWESTQPEPGSEPQPGEQEDSAAIAAFCTEYRAFLNLQTRSERVYGEELQRLAGLAPAGIAPQMSELARIWADKGYRNSDTGGAAYDAVESQVNSWVAYNCVGD